MPAYWRCTFLLPVLLTALPCAHASDQRDGQPDATDSLAALYGDADLVRIATSTSKPAFLAPAVTAVLTAEDIAGMGARTLEELLESLPGIHVQPSELNRMDNVVVVRGISSAFNPQVLFLLNDVPLTNGFASAKPVQFQLPADFIERIEVIRGPGSAIYGADAYSAVINIITRRPVADADWLGGLRAGRFGTRDLWLRAEQRIADWQLSAHLSQARTDGDDSRIVSTDTQTLLDSIFGTQASLAPGAIASRKNMLTAQLEALHEHGHVRYWRWQQRDAGVGVGAGSAVDPAGRDHVTVDQLDALWQWPSADHRWQHQLRYTQTRQRLDALFVIFPAGAVMPVGADGNIDFVAPRGVSLFSDGLIGNPLHEENARRGEWELLWTGWSQHRLRFAVGGQTLDFDAGEKKNFGPGVLDGTQAVVAGPLTDVSDTPHAYLPDGSRRVWWLSVQDEWQLAPDWELTLGARHDDFSDVGASTTPRAALVWQTSRTLTSKLLYGRAFRAPAIAELYFQNNPSGIGNPRLQPEQMRTSELVFDFRPAQDWLLQLNLYDFDATDLIRYVRDSNATTSTARNIGELRGRGVEALGRWQGAGGNWQLSWARYDTEERPAGHDAADVPGQLAQLWWQQGLNEALHLDARYKRIMDRQRPAGDTRAAPADYGWLSLALVWTPADWPVRVTLSVQNAADSDAREPASAVIVNDLPRESRSYWLGADLRW